jgi:hypothetical protein
LITLLLVSEFLESFGTAHGCCEIGKKIEVGELRPKQNPRILSALDTQQVVFTAGGEGHDAGGSATLVVVASDLRVSNVEGPLSSAGGTGTDHKSTVADNVSATVENGVSSAVEQIFAAGGEGHDAGGSATLEVVASDLRVSNVVRPLSSAGGTISCNMSPRKSTSTKRRSKVEESVKAPVGCNWSSLSKKLKKSQIQICWCTERLLGCHKARSG